MKIVLSATSPSLDAKVDPRFGRGAFLLVVDTTSLEFEAHPNPGVTATGGAGIQAAQFVATQKAEAAISGDFGPNAFEALQQAGVSMYTYGDCQTVREAIQNLQSGGLERVGSPSRGGGARGRRGA
jgi:predicted Fe-Mo cluster-binding NifX family protein